MRKIVAILICFEMILFAVDFVDESQFSDHIVGKQDLVGAKFVGDKIWQDQPINAKINIMNYAQAEQYCKNLKLLGIQKWTLPSKIDFKVLDDDMTKLRYRAYRQHLFSFYYTNTPTVDDYVYVVDISTNKSPYFSGSKKDTKNCVRCVLNPNTYNSINLSKAKKIAQNGNLDSYLKAFLLSGEKRYIKKAIGLAKTREEKGKIEAALYQYLGFLKVFKLINKGEILSSESKTLDTNNRLLAGMIKEKKLKYRFKVVPRKDSPLKLKYNRYEITLNFNLYLTYDVATWGVVTTKKKVLHVQKKVVLSKDNGYSSNLTVDFGNVQQAGEVRFLLISSKSRLDKAYMTYSLENYKIEYQR